MINILSKIHYFTLPGSAILDLYLEVVIYGEKLSTVFVFLHLYGIPVERPADYQA